MQHEQPRPLPLASDLHRHLEEVHLRSVAGTPHQRQAHLPARAPLLGQIGAHRRAQEAQERQNERIAELEELACEKFEAKQFDDALFIISRIKFLGVLYQGNYDEAINIINSHMPFPLEEE